jgi:hypothetical protein
MGRRRQLAIGLILLIAGLVVVAIGMMLPSNDPIVALGWLLLLPVLVSTTGAVFTSVSLARSFDGGSPFATVRRIVGLPAVAGLGLALGYGAAGLLSQVPDSLAGLNGPFVPGSAPGLSAFFLGGVGLSMGLVIGTIAAIIWWTTRRRRLLADLSTSR